MKNKFQSKAVPRGTRTIWRYLSALFILFTFAIGQMWADCEKGTLLFSMEVTSNPSSKIQVSAKSGGVNGSLDLAANANVTVVGTSAVMYNSNSSAYDAITTAGEICFKSSSKHWIEISFPCALAAGDLITFTTTKTNPIAFSGTASGTKYNTTDNKLEISTSGTSELIGKTSLWIWRPGSEPNVKSLRIIRPATITLDAATNGGTVSVTSIKGATGDKVVLPHAFKSDYKFKGWYTAATEGTRRADYYTVSGDETVVAQFEALPSSGEMFSLEMQESMKPAADISLDKGKQRDLLEFAIISGGAAIGANTTSSSNHFKITSAGKISFNGTAAYMIINLDFPLAAGDIIATDVSAKTWVSHLTSAPSSGPYVDGTNTSYTIKSTDTDLIGATTLYLWRGSNATLSEITITRPTPHTLSYAVDPAGKGTVTLGATSLIEGETTTATYSAIDAAYEFDTWQISGTGATLSGASGDHVTVTMGSTDATVTLKLKAAVTKYTITYSKGAYGTGDAIPDGKKDEGVDFTLSSSTYSRDGYVQTGWATEDGGAKAYDLGGTYSIDADEELFPFWTPVYTVTKGTHENGDFTISPASLVAGGTVTLDPTPDDGYMFSAWEIVKTSDASATGITVTNKQFEMPAYGVTVNATFVADTRKKVLYLTSASTSGDKLYTALKDDYKLTVAAPASQDLSDYDLVVLHESIDGKAAENGTSNTKQVIRDILTTTTPVLNTKAYFYNNSGTKRWDWGAPNAGTSVKGATQNSAYCNIASHPLFDGLTITDGFFDITDEAAAKCMQPVGSFTSGKEGYTLATTPNSGEGNGCAIHELTPAQRGASAGKYLMISVSNAKLNALNANGQKLFQNAAAYLVDGSASWAPISVPTAAEVTATPSENYTEGNTITLTASATGTTVSTTYTWYKGADWATASATTPVQAAATDGNVFTKTAALEDAGTYWCNISNGTSCDVQASVTITVSSASTPTHAISYDNTKGADMTAYPTEYTEGVGVASFAALADIAGWHFVEWSPASIAADATTDQTITAVWAQVFEVTFDLQGHGAAIAAQNIVSGGKVTKPDDPIAIGWDFGGWFTDADCTAGNEWDFDNDVVSAATPLFAKWTEFDGCALLVPATSGENAGVGDAIVMQTGSKGATMTALAIPDGGSLAYTANGLAFNKKSGVKTNVVLNNDMKVGTKISLKLVAGGDKTRGLFLYTKTGTKIEAFTCWVEGVNPAVENEEETFTYTVVADDGLEGTNEFQLWRNNTVYLKQLAVTECGAAVVYHNLTSAVDPAGKGTVTLDASSVREGLTTKATYSDIDPLYEFVSWSISGAGASIADATANPAIVTVGTEDAVITLNLQLIPEKFTVEYYDGATLMGSEQVAVNENPTASEIVTAKRHYTFLGWSETDGGNVVALNTITRTGAGTVKLYAKYEAVACPTSGTIFSMEAKANDLTSNLQPNGNTVISLEPYVTISGGEAKAGNFGSSKHVTIAKTTSEIQFTGANAYMYMLLDCQLQKGDSIKFDNSEKFTLSVDSLKTKKADIAKNTNYYIVPETWVGADTILIWRNGNNVKFNKINVIRPAKFDVSFNMMGYGTQIADIEDVIEGSKITAPTAPTDEDYSFAGWYKENTLANEWKFDVDVVEANTTLYAKWLDKSDATLKSLKYGETEIALEAGVYIYNVSLPAFTSAVPALTAETSNPSATKVIANAAAFDSEGNATSTVTVTPEVGADQVYTVKFAKGVEILLQDVTGSITWNFANAVIGTVNITGTPQVLANYGGVTNDNTFESDKLEASGEKFTAGSNANLRANYIRFHTTVPGILSISYSNTGGSNPARYIYVNGVKYDEEGSASTTKKGLDTKVFVPAGDVELVMKDGEDVSKNVQIYQMIFNATPDYTRDVTEGKYGTICLPTNGVMIGTTIYTLAFYGATSQKIFFDEVVTGRMEAGKPYLFLPEQGVTELKVFYTDSETKAAQTVNGFHGYIGDSEDPEDALPVPAGEGNYIVQNNTYREVQAGATAYILSHRAYITFSEIGTTEPAKAPGARRIGLGKDAAQGFENLNASETPMKVMIDGTLYIIRGEKVYNANGQVVK